MYGPCEGGHDRDCGAARRVHRISPDRTEDGDDLDPAGSPIARERGDLELLLSGAYRPLTGFLGRADAEAVASTGWLADGTPWPVPVTLELPDELAGLGLVTLTDPEGASLATLEVTEVSPAGAGRQLVAGRLTALTAPAYGAFRRLHRSPAQVAAELTGGPVLAMVVDAPLHTRDIGDVRSAAADLSARVLLLAG